MCVDRTVASMPTSVPWDCGDGVLRYLAASPLSGMPMGARAHFARVGPQHDDCFTDLPICGRLESSSQRRVEAPAIVGV